MSLANHSCTANPVNQSNALQIHVAEAKRGKTRASESQLVLVVLSCDWIAKWREFFKPIAWRSDAKPKQMPIAFDSQMKTALLV